MQLTDPPASTPVARRWGKLIERKRLDRDLTQTGLAELVGVRQTTISVWENGRWVPSAKHQQTLIRELAIADNELARIYRGDAA